MSPYDPNPNEEECQAILPAGDSRSPRPFLRANWVKDAMAWICKELGRNIAFTGEMRQLNPNGDFALVRFDVLEGPAYWLKATSGLNAHEGIITMALARLFSEYLPPLIAYRRDWNAWVMEDAGEPLCQAVSLSGFERAIQTLGELQIASIRHVKSLLGQGCADQRIPVLIAGIPALITYLEEVMSQQTSTQVQPLSVDQLHELGRLLEDALRCLDLLGVPDALIHNDINLSNILVGNSRCVITDWAEAYVGTPFVTFQHLTMQALKEDPSGEWGTRLTNIYRKHWRTQLNESTIDRALALSPPIAIASYLFGRDPAFTAEYRIDASARSYARSLARHLHRAIRTPKMLEALCN